MTCPNPLPPAYLAWERWRLSGGIKAERPAGLPQRIPQVWWACLQERRPKPRPDRTEPPVWREAGVFAELEGNYDFRVGRGAGFLWEAWPNASRVIWHVATPDPIFDADAAIAALAGCFILDAEDVYEGANRGRSKVFLDLFRKAHPTIPLLLSGNAYGGEGGVRDFDYAAWITAGASFAPQAYAQAHPELSVRNAVAHALRAGWPLHRIHPTLGTYSSTAEGALITPAIVDQYVADLRACGVVGFSIFVGDQTPVWVFDQLSKEIRAGGLTA